MREKKLNLAFAGITNYYTARSMAARELKKSRYSRELDNIRPD
ncbi:baseplate hub protein [Aeromonas phage AhSzq-1]|uniref:Baseplate hub protein n=1 Tax=Aeromonas phage AhSzq-1 TaxID=2138298 RepID=A0A2R4ALS3_9CAUD|nr:baseplate hub protein [Aeromonas phage AhSzq-1]AVR76009.1 baseplate hub protein [Aeromonas phage AhSzq-1]